jgi:hypothetical protein
MVTVVHTKGINWGFHEIYLIFWKFVELVLG